MSDTIECPNCGWQGHDHQTDASHCPECGDQTMPIQELYGAEPDWSGTCDNCGASPIVPVTGLCGPCTFGEADTAGGNW